MDDIIAINECQKTMRALISKYYFVSSVFDWEDYYQYCILELIQRKDSWDSTKASLPTYMYNYWRKALQNVNRLAFPFSISNQGYSDVMQDGQRPFMVDIDDFAEIHHACATDADVVDHEVIDAIFMNKVKAALSMLSAEDQYVITRSFGVFGYPKLTQKEIAKNLKKSEQAVSRQKYAALNKMKDYLALLNISKEDVK